MHFAIGDNRPDPAIAAGMLAVYSRGAGVTIGMRMVKSQQRRPAFSLGAISGDQRDGINLEMAGGVDMHIRRGPSQSDSLLRPEQ